MPHAHNPWRAPSVWIYELPRKLVSRHSSPTGQNVVHDVLDASLRRSRYMASSASTASFFYVPVPFHWGGKGRDDVAAILSHIRTAWPFFNRSLESHHPNHLLLFTGDLAMDLPNPRAHPPLPAEVDASSGARHFVALTLTGNPEAGFQRGKDVVLPPTHNLKGGPMRSDACCASATLAAQSPFHAVQMGAARRQTQARGEAHARRPVHAGHTKATGRSLARAAVWSGSHGCKVAPRSLADSPWRPRTDALPSNSSRLSFLASWSGQASGGGIGRHGGSGVRVRRWLSRLASTELPGSLITDTNHMPHLRRNVETLPASVPSTVVTLALALALNSPRPLPQVLSSTVLGHKAYGHISPLASLSSTFCLAPYGRGNGWEGRSASAIRGGCIPLSIAPPGSVRALEPFVPWSRFAIFVPDTPNGQIGARVRRAIEAPTEAERNAMRCEMACAATHMSWGAPVPPASCAAAVQVHGDEHGVVPTLLKLLDNRRQASAQRQAPRPCPCQSHPSEWHF